MEKKHNNNREMIQIKKIVTIYYREFTDSYQYKGERHNFWEVHYVDKGGINVVADDAVYWLEQGDMIFHAPNEFHALSSVDGIEPNVIVISFVCLSEAMAFFIKRIVKIPPDIRYLIANVIREAKGAFKPQLGELFLAKNRLENPAFAAEQLMYMYLEMLLIFIYRSNLTNIKPMGNHEAVINEFQSGKVNAIKEYLEEHICGNLRFEDICKEFYIGETTLKSIFKESTGIGVMTYYKNLKMEEAKRLIRKGTMNFTEISSTLGFTSVHYFSSAFKRHFNMNPSEYLSSIKLFEEDGNTRR